MITLRTGVPGGGKTLHMVEHISKLFKRWEKFPAEARPVFVHNIPFLAFPVAELPFHLVPLLKGEAPVLVPDWKAVPDGSYVFIDEAQGKFDEETGRIKYHLFPPRSAAVAAPAHVAWLNTHRHHGIDIDITTQHPKLLDSGLRALVGKHMHLRRLFGRRRAVVYEWDACSDNLSGQKNAVTTYWPYPKKIFEFYKSAEVHTKQNFKLPKWMLLPVLGLAMAVVFFPKAYGVLFPNVKEKFHTVAPVSAAADKSFEPVAAPKVGAIAHTEGAATGFDFSKPMQADATDKPRLISVLKFAHGVYTDNPADFQHFTDEQLAVQARSVSVLDHHEKLRPVLVAVPVEPPSIPLAAPNTFVSLASAFR